MVDDPFAGRRLLEGGYVVVFVDGAAGDDLPAPGSLPVVVAHLGDRLGGEGPVAADLVVAEADGLDHAIEVTLRHPEAARALVVLLRQTERLAVDAALAAESAAYSMLQAAADFHRWRNGRSGTTPRLHDDAPTVLLDRRDDELIVNLNRPHRHNAISRGLRDELCDALAIAVLDDTIRTVTLAGRGPSFYSGGDLDEFGARRDVAEAHTIRLAQSPARLVHRIRDRTTVHLHGAAFGGGIELAAFAGRVTADPATRIGLPEIGLGLIPGAGGTVSLPRRIGRQRTAALALAIPEIDATTALSWGLVDAVEQERTTTE